MNKAEANRSPRWLSPTILLILMGLALALRWRYIQDISLSVDEFNTIWAARNVLVRGLPSYPSGNIYPHGFLFTYLQVPFALGEMNETWVRIPGLIVGLAGIPVAYWVGKKLFDQRVGLITAAAMAVDPDVILWGGRARMYGLLQLLTLLIAYFFYRGIREDRPRDRYLALGLVVLAIFTHAEAALLLPALGLALLIAWPWRRILRWNVILPFGLAAVGLGAFFLMSKFGQPGHLETLQESRPYLALSTEVLSGPMVFAPVFARLHRLPFTILTIAGIYFLFRPRFDRRAPLTYIYAILLGTLVPLLVLAGATWQNERYLFMLLPLLFIAGAQTLCSFLDLVPFLRNTIRWQSIILPLVIVLYVGLTGTHLAYTQEEGYDLAFRYVRDHWNPEAGDLVITPSPVACVLYLGDCDAFAIQRGYEEFVVQRVGDDLTADLWTASPVLTKTAELESLLETGPNVWFISDGWRFQTRYDADFIQTILDQMTLEYDERGVMVWQSLGHTPAWEPAIQRERWAPFDEALALTAFDLSTDQPVPGQELEVTLRWQALEQAGVAYTAFLHLLDAEGESVSGIDEPVLGGLYQPALWPAGATLADRHRLSLPPDLPPGNYRLDLGLYPTGQAEKLLPVEDGDRLPLAMLQIGNASFLPSPSTTTEVAFGNQIQLKGYDLDCDSEPNTCQLRLIWQAGSPMERDYTVFVHLVGPDGTIIAQDDAPPGPSFFPTSTWLPGAVSDREHLLTWSDDTPAGDYTILIGIYHQPTNDRLEATSASGESLGDVLSLTKVPIALESP